MGPVQIIPRGTVWGDPGTWRGLQTADGRSASVTCPECGESATLTGHDISDDGTVTPSVVCPHDGCSWHAWVKLDGWAPGR